MLNKKLLVLCLLALTSNAFAGHTYKVTGGIYQKSVESLTEGMDRILSGEFDYTRMRNKDGSITYIQLGGAQTWFPDTDKTESMKTIDGAIDGAIRAFADFDEADDSFEKK